MMATAYSSRDIVEDFLRHKLLSSGLVWSPERRHPTGVRRRHNTLASASASASSWRADRAVTSHQGVSHEDTQQDPRLAPPRLQAVLRCAGDELERRYHGELAAHASALLLSGGGGADPQQGLTTVSEELFRDGVNWGRIVAMMELGGALCTEVVRRGGPWQVDDIVEWMEQILESAQLREWIEDNGGWEAFVDLYSESRPSSSFWSLRTLFGLAVVGAAGIILGALFTRN